MEDKNYLSELFNRYLNDHCSDKEVEILLQYFGSEAGEEILRDLICKHLEVSVNNHHDDLPTDTHNLLLKSAYRNIANKTYLKKEKRKTVLLNQNVLVKLLACASIIVIICAFFFFKDLLRPVVYKQIIALKGERKQFRLADGTRIWLAPGSILDYTEVFKGKTREVRLKGEAFFEVAHDQQHPFIVHTTKINTTVLGTSFNVKAYPDRSVIEVALLTGKVNVSTQNESNQQESQLMLSPYQRAVFNKTDETLHKENDPNANDILARREGRFIYKGMALRDVINDISRVYNVNIVLDDKVQNMLYYGEFNQKDRLQVVLMEISLASNTQLKNKGAIWELRHSL